MNRGADISQGQKQVCLPSTSWQWDLEQYNELAYALGFFSCDTGPVPCSRTSW